MFVRTLRQRAREMHIWIGGHVRDTVEVDASSIERRS